MFNSANILLNLVGSFLEPNTLQLGEYANTMCRNFGNNVFSIVNVVWNFVVRINVCYGLLLSNCVILLDRKCRPQFIMVIGVDHGMTVE